MKFFITLLGLTLLGLSIGMTPCFAFSDIEGSQYFQSIEALEARGIVEGYGADDFRPFEAVNRAEFLKILVSSQGDVLETPKEPCFSDVPMTAWYAPYVCHAQEKGIVQGYEDGTFRPGNPINMVEAFSIAKNVFELNVETVENGQWFDPLRNRVHEANIFSKYSFRPSRSIRREETAHLLNELILDEEEVRSLGSERISLSQGCGIAPPQIPPSTFSVGGEERSAIVFVPENYSPEKSYQLVIAFHGRTSSNASVRRYYGIERAAQDKAIVVYPAGKAISSYSYQWTTDDYAFFDELYAQLTAQYCIDRDAVFVMGHSLGAWMANNLACTRGHMIRGVATLGGSRSERNCSGPTAAMIWHNPQDNLVSFNQGVSAKNAFREFNGCGVEETPAQPSNARCVSYNRCGAYTPVVWCPHTLDTYQNGQYTPHTWPRGTGRAMWDFFQEVYSTK